MAKTGILKRFRDDKRGSAYVMAALALVPIFGMMALAVDVTNHDRIKTDLETAAETVALHIAKRVALDPNRPADEFVTEGKTIFASLVGVPLTYDQFSVDMSTGKVKIVASTSVDTHFMHMFGHDQLKASTKTQAQFGRQNIDVALAIDNSGSMRHNISDGDGGNVKKIDAAKAAAKLLVTSASDSVADLSNASLRFSIVPWHSHVSLPHSEIRSGASESAAMNAGTWANWIDWEGRSTNHFTYLAPYKANGAGDHGDMYFDVNGDDEWHDYDPEALKDLLPKEADGKGVDVNALRANANIGVVTRYDVFNNTGVSFNGCFEHRAGDYRYSFEPATTSTYANPSDDPNFDGDSLYVPNMAPDERDYNADDGSTYGSRNNYLKDVGGDSDHNDGYHEASGGNGDDGAYNEGSNDGEKARVMNSAKYVNIDTSNDLWIDSDDNPNGSCNTAKVLPLNDDIRGIDGSNPKGDIVTAIDAMDSNGFTDQSIGLVWAMNSLTPWKPLDQGGSFDDTQKVMIFMTDGYNETRNKHDYKESYMSFQYPRDDVWDGYANAPTGDQINYQINEATKKQCDAIKARGVKIYYIYFGTPNADAEAIKNHCASTPEAAIEATNSAQLEAAFEKIGDDIGKLRLTHYTPDPE